MTTKLHAIAWVALLAAAAAACKKTQVTCADPPESSHDGEVDEATQKMIDAAKTNPSLCRELASPRISLTGDELVVTAISERRIARRIDLPASEIRGVNRLSQNLRSIRSQFKTIHPGEDTAAVDLRFDPTLETARASSIILTAAYAGYDRAQLTTGASAPLPVTWYRLGPPDSNYIFTLLRVEATSDTTLSVQVAGPGCKKGPAVAATVAELRATVARLCRENERPPGLKESWPPLQIGRCLDAVEVRALPGSRIGDTAAVLRAITDALAAQKPTPEIALLLAGSEPKLNGFPPSPLPSFSTYAPHVDGSAHCTLPDGGTDDEPDGGSQRRLVR